ncbi:DUF126 domain-containing protein [bacterium]|nr:DUF126 domain-containing protein [bacterium]
MADRIVKAKGMIRGEAAGEALVCHKAFSFLGDVDMDTGVIIARGHEHEGVSIAGRVMIYPETKGSSGGCIVLMVLAKLDKQPAAIVLMKPADPNIVEGAILCGIPLLSEPDEDLLAAVPNGTTVTVNGTTGEIRWRKAT